MILVFAALMASAPARITVPEALNEIGRKYGLQIEVVTKSYVWNSGSYKVYAEPVSQEALDKYAVLFAKEWSRYPVGVMGKAKTKKIVFGDKVRLDQQYRAAVPAFEGDTMYYDAVLGSYNPNYQRAVVHHEFFHMIDQRMGLIWVDKDWSALSKSGFKYGSGGANMRDGNAGALTDKLPGFLTAYATAGVEEDKAEVFSHLLVNRDFVMKRVSADPVMAKKVEFLKKRMKGFDAGFGAEFWAR